MYSRKHLRSLNSVLSYVGRQERIGDPLLCKKMLGDRLNVSKTLYRKDLYSHYGCVNAIEFSNDGEWLVSGGDDKRVLVWNVNQMLSRSPKPAIMNAEHNSNIFCLSFDITHAKVFSAGNDEQVLMHDVDSGEIVDVYLHDKAVYGLSVDPVNESIYASACEDGRILLWDIRASTTDAFMLAGCHSAFHAVMHNPAEPRLIASANAKEGVGLWDTRKPGVYVVQYGGSLISQSAMSVRFNSVGTHLLALRRRLPPVLYEVHSPHGVVEFDHKEYYNSCTMKSCCFAGENDQYILSGSDDFKLYMWKIPNEILTKKGTTIKEAHLILRGHRSIVNQVRYNNSFGILASSGVEKVIKLWSTFPLEPHMEYLTENSITRKVYSHEEYINLVLESGQFMSHDYSHHSVQEDPRMMAFFDSLVQRDIEGWTSDSSETGAGPSVSMCFEVQRGLSSSSSSSESSSDEPELIFQHSMVQPGRMHNSRDYEQTVNFSMTLPPPEFAHRMDPDPDEPLDMSLDRISQMIARKRNDQMRKSERTSNKLKKRLKVIKTGARAKINGKTSIGHRKSILNNARHVLSSVVRDRVDSRKLLMRRRAKIMKPQTINIASDSSDSEANDVKPPVFLDTGLPIDLSLIPPDDAPSPPVIDLSPIDEKPIIINGVAISKSNGAIDPAELPSTTQDCSTSLPHCSTSGVNGIHPSSSSTEATPTTQLPRTETNCLFLQSKNRKHHSRNYRKSNKGGSQDE